MREIKNELTIGIPIYNEEDNIKKLIISLSDQKYIKIKNLILVNDGSIDNTLKKINTIRSEIKNKVNLRLINLEKNFGKPNALNIIFKNARTKYLVILDSDIQLMENSSIYQILMKAEKNKLDLVCGGHFTEVSSYFDFIGRSYRFSKKILEKLALKLNNIYGATGAFVVLSKGVYQNLEIPINAIRDDAFIYLWVISKRKKFLFYPKVKIKLIPKYKNLSTFFRSQKRGEDIPDRYYDFFGNLVNKEFKKPPLKILIPSLFECFYTNTLDGLCWVILKFPYLFYKMLMVNKRVDIKWRN